MPGALEDGRYWGHSHPTTLPMSEEQLKAFMEAVKADAGLQEKLNAAADAADAVVAIAKTAGFVISADQLQRAQAEISEEELEGVAGGNFYNLGKQQCPPNFTCPPSEAFITS